MSSWNNLYFIASMVCILNWPWYWVTKTNIVTRFSSLSFSHFSKLKMDVHFLKAWISDFKNQKLIKDVCKSVCVFLPVLKSIVVSLSTPDGTAVLNTTPLGRAEGMQKQASPWETRACLFYEKSANCFPVQMSYFTFSLVKTGVTNGSLYASEIGLVWKKGLPCLYVQEVTSTVALACSSKA